MAERVVALLTRTRARLDVELGKMSALQGDFGVEGFGGMGYGIGSKWVWLCYSPCLFRDAHDSLESLPLAQITDSLKAALSPLAAGGDLVTSAYKSGYVTIFFHFAISLLPPAERKLLSQGSLKSHTAPHSPSQTPTPSGYGRSRLSQQVQRSGRRTAAIVQEEDDMDMDADGEDEEELDADGEEDAEDKNLYCFCRQMSHGEVRPYLRCETSIVADISSSTR